MDKNNRKRAAKTGRRIPAMLLDMDRIMIINACEVDMSGLSSDNDPCLVEVMVCDDRDACVRFRKVVVGS